MSHIDEGDAELLVHLLELYLHVLPHLQVEGSQRLVKKKYSRLVHDGAGYGHTLLLTS